MTPEAPISAANLISDVQALAPMIREFGFLVVAFFILLLFGISLVWYFVLAISKRLKDVDSSIQSITTLAKISAEDADESVKLLNERTVILRGITDMLQNVTKDNTTINNCLNNCHQALIRLEAKQVDDLPLLLKLLSEQQKEIVKRIDSVIQTIIDAIHRSY